MCDNKCLTRTVSGPGSVTPYCDMGSSSRTCPASTSWSTIVDANVLVSEARWYWVSGVASTLSARSEWPKPFAHTMSVPLAMAAENAGILSATRNCSRCISNSAISRAAGRLGTLTLVEPVPQPNIARTTVMHKQDCDFSTTEST